MPLKRHLLLLLGAVLLSSNAASGDQFTPVDLVELPSPSGPITSPSGALAVYSQAVYNAADAKSTSQLYLLDIASNTVEELTPPSYTTADTQPFFLDDLNIAYFHHDVSSDVDQLYVLNLLQRDAPYQLTNFSISFENVKYHVQEQMLVFSAAVYREDGSLEGTFKRDQENSRTVKDTALVFDQLMVRHWDQYVTEKNNNLFVVHLKCQDLKYKLVTEPLNLLKGTGLISPGFPLGDASDYAISPDGLEIAFLSKITTPDNAWETSAYIYRVSTDGQGRPQPINDDIPAASSAPYYFGHNLVYLQMMTPQHESDRNRIVLYNLKTGERKTLVQDWDLSPNQVLSSPDAKVLYVTAEEQGRQRIYSIDIQTEKITTMTEEHSVSNINVLPSGDLVYGSSSFMSPTSASLFNVSTGKITPLASESKLELKLSSLAFSQPEEFRFIGALDEQVHGWYFKPTQFEEGKSYPVAFLIHGGPHTSWDDTWSLRWNPQVYANAGYGVIAINYHGSTGYGQNFTESMRHHWGSYPLYDLETGLDYILDKYAYLDRERVAGLGGSVGGYLINWINGNSNKFKALVCHDGAFSLSEIYYTTDETYFCEYEFGGSPINPEDRKNYDKWSPSNFVHLWNTPTLYIHGTYLIT
ncbi:alpha/beta-hydrolase [Backusella circina FSU 941]|nr:alpha/beta-hydrolase [Backusella circina FSU 941]